MTMTPTGKLDEAAPNTLDEPVMDTIKRDVNAIVEKLRYVMLPKARVDKVGRMLGSRTFVVSLGISGRCCTTSTFLR